VLHEERPSEQLLERLLTPTKPIDALVGFCTARKWIQKYCTNERLITMVKNCPYEPRSRKPTIVPIHQEPTLAPNLPYDRGRIPIYTDGSYLDGFAGSGIHFPTKAVQDIAYSFAKDDVHTVMRAELMAIIIALTVITSPSHIFSDSLAVLDGIEAYRDWHELEFAYLLNGDLWHRLVLLLRNRDAIFTKVKAHTGIRGNEAADRLAKRAARNAAHPRGGPRLPR